MLTLSRTVVLTRELFDEVKSAIRNELDGPGSMSGYRAMWRILRLKYRIFVPRSVVMNALREIDPSGTSDRRRHRLTRRTYFSLGPNFCWHIDGYDKLKPYGFPIHGCIDGYSRKIIWLELLSSNNDPFAISRLYIKAVSEFGGCPKRMRSDCGTENVGAAAIQSYLRRNHSDCFAGTNAHVYGTSPSNQRQEAWWSFFRRHRSNWIINFFKEMVECDEFHRNDPLEVSCLRFCFGPLLQNDLQSWPKNMAKTAKNGVVLDTTSNVQPI